jgi:hypothetical protein
MEINEQKLKQGRLQTGKITINNNNKQTEVNAYV